MAIPKIPRSFTIGPHKWTVKILPLKAMAQMFPEDKDNPPMGATMQIRNLIVVQDVREGFSESQQYHTFWHEYFHALLFASGHTAMSNDEDLVDLLGMLTAQAMITCKY